MFQHSKTPKLHSGLENKNPNEAILPPLTYWLTVTETSNYTTSSVFMVGPRWSARSCFCVLVSSSRTSFLSQRSPVGPLFPPKKSLQFLNTHGELRVTSESSRFTRLFHERGEGQKHSDSRVDSQNICGWCKRYPEGFHFSRFTSRRRRLLRLQKREIFLFLKKTFSLGCTEEKYLWVLSSNSGRFSEAPWRGRLSCGLSQEAKVKFCVCPLASSCCVCGAESHLHTWFPLSRGNTQRSPQGKQTDRKLRGVPQQPKNLQKNARYFMRVSWSTSSFGNSFDQVLEILSTGVQKFCCLTIKC